MGRLEMEGGGAVRHGAECFNFYFPQELDEELLVISENIPDSSVPWKYMSVEELQIFLHGQIDLGYTFPLNLKWVLCDKGWKRIYDKLLESQKPNVQDSVSIWYPPESGIRQQIEEISSRHPNGFQRTEKPDPEARQSGTAKMDLALEKLSSEFSLGSNIKRRNSDSTSQKFTRRSGTEKMDLALDKLVSITGGSDSMHTISSINGRWQSWAPGSPPQETRSMTRGKPSHQ